MKINQKQIDAVCSLPGPKRYEHFVKVVTDWEEVWGLYSEGWASAGTDDGQLVFPVWPAKEYAELCATKEWDGYEARSFSLDDFVNALLPKLQNEGALIGVFYTPNEKGVTPEVKRLIDDINMELDNY